MDLETIQNIIDLDWPARPKAMKEIVPTDRDFFTTTQAAALMFLTPGNLRLKMCNLDIDRPKLKLGQSYLWSREEVIAAIEAVEMQRQRHSRELDEDNFPLKFS